MLNVYAGAFLIAFSALALEITFSRILSVVTWYHLAFFAVSTAMLGMTAGAVRVYLTPERYTEDRLGDEIGGACVRYALAVPVSLIVLCLLPLHLEKTVMSLFGFLIGTVACALPFFFSGMALSAILTKYRLPIGRLYASDLIGASLGCLFVLGGLEVFDAPSLVLLCAAAGVLASLAFRADRLFSARGRRGLTLFAAFVLVALVNASTPYGIRPFVVKGKVEDPGRYLLETWNSFSRVVAYRGTKDSPHYWGPSPLAPRAPVYMVRMTIDGEAGTYMRRFESREDVEHLAYDVPNIGYYLGRRGPACIVGVGGGRDVQSALFFGHERVIGLEVNPVFVELLEGPFRDFAGIAGKPGVELIVDDARNWLTRCGERFAVIQMSLIDTWASTGAGAFSLSENALYTVEAWKLFLDRLAGNGVFSVSRWHNPGQLSETGRVLGLAVAALLKQGAEDPSRHIAFITTEYMGTLLISRRPFSEQDVAQMEQVCADLHYEAAHLPGKPPADDVLRGIVLARNEGQLAEATKGHALNYTPPTDENPYFFNMLKLTRLGSVSGSTVLRGNLIATLTLLVLLGSLAVLTVVTIAAPLALRQRVTGMGVPATPAFWAGAAYFCLIGAAFMFLEIGLIQKLAVFLGHPTYALGVLLFGLIASTGVGSLLNDRLPLARRPWMFVYPLVTVAAIGVTRFVLARLLVTMAAATIAQRVGATVAVIFPLGILMGQFFPTGMRIARESLGSETPWYWALNGICGVLCSALAVFLSIYSGISTNFAVAAVCYAAVIVCLIGMKR